MKQPLIFIALIHLVCLFWCPVHAQTSQQQDYREINEHPLKDIKIIITDTYALYRKQQDVLPKNFSMMVNFDIEESGAISYLRVIKTSGAKLIDEAALRILWNIGQSHILVMLYGQTDNRAVFELSEATVRLAITGVSASESDAKAKAQMLGQLLNLIQEARKETVIGKFIGSVRVTSEKKRVDVEIAIERGRAAEILRGWISEMAR